MTRALDPTSFAMSFASDLPLGASAPIASGLRIQPFKKWPKSSAVCECGTSDMRSPFSRWSG
jgi:hypothetical protein